MDVGGTGAVLITRRNDDEFARHLRVNRLPLWRLGVLFVNGFQSPRDCALSALSRDVEWTRLIIEKERLNQIRSIGIAREIAIEIHIAPLDLRLEHFRRRIIRIVNLQVPINLRIGIYNVVDKVLVLGKTPRSAWAETKACVFAARDILRCALPVAPPVELAARVNQPLNLHI